MTQALTYHISITGPDKVGHVAQITGYLFEIGANLADTSFAVLGEGFDFSSMASFPDGTDAGDVRDGLMACGIPDTSTVRVVETSLELDRSERGSVTHVIEFSGGDRPGLIARMSEVIGKYGANIVRMSSRRHKGPDGYLYMTRFAINVQDEDISALESALVNTAGSLRLQCEVEAV